MTKYCYVHPKKEAFKECERCGKPICHKCAVTYWYSNTISAMFYPQKDSKQKVTLCKKCVRMERIKNLLVTSFLLLLIIGFIAATIIISVRK